jgi:ferredoxin/flavodoxin---NADP+ reductase
MLDGTLQVAIIGSGPSGFYAAEALLRSGVAVQVDLFERLPAPFGLVRYGVAPDHPKLKEPILVYDRIAHSPAFEFLGNVRVGVDVSVDELRSHYHAVILAYGAPHDRKLNIPGEDLPGSYAATDLVGWYNGHPGYRHLQFDLSGEVAIIVGQGNVATDICRMLLCPIDQLKTTDIAEHALDAIASSNIREIFVLGRRGPAQAKFTSKELRELGDISGVDPIVDADDLQLNLESDHELKEKTNFAAAKNIELFRAFSTHARSAANKKIYFKFLCSPVAAIGDQRVQALQVCTNKLAGAPFSQRALPTGETFELPCDPLVRSVGSHSVALRGVAFDETLGLIPNNAGRVIDASGSIQPGLYVTGWAKRGATGIIGTNRADSVATVQALIDDLDKLGRASKPGAQAIRALLSECNVKIVSYSDWLKIDAAELARGAAKHKPREKFTTIAEMLALLEPFA